ncbi:MAG: hypothetical protein JWM11_6230, partial [Planctomycetaceae bacterium]|nr:hypothetical protein [Planctomycetaceae bacterium]
LDLLQFSASSVTRLSNQIDNGPLFIPLLEVRKLQFYRLMPSQSASKKDGEKCSIAFAFLVAPHRAFAVEFRLAPPLSNCPVARRSS